MHAPPRTRWIALTLTLLLAPGCEGLIVLETGDGAGGGGGGGRPRVEIDSGAGMPPGFVDAGPGGGVDAGPGIAPMGCDLPAQGQCDGAVARWCVNDVEQSQDCATAGQTCQLDTSLGRVACASAGPPPPTGCGSAEELAVIDLANEARGGTGTVTCDVDMARTARNHSQDMCDQGYFSHTSRDGRSPFDRMRDEGVSFRTAGENIAQGQRDAASVHNSWMNSSGHRANIMNGAYGRIGVGLAECGGRMYWTQVFAD